MSKIKCLIVDDEPLALDVLETYISNIEHLQLAGKCKNAIEALNQLQKQKVDLLFLDIQMPQLTGIEFLKTLRHPPKVILTTAFRDYALEGYELNVLDYLLKPISFDRFLMAVSKLGDINSLPAITSPNVALVASTSDAFMYVKADKKMVKIFLKDILYIESLKDYVKIRTTTRTVVTYQKISFLEEKLPSEQFIRVHRSFIVALQYVQAFTLMYIEVEETEIPIGRMYKNETLRRLGVKNLS